MTSGSTAHRRRAYSTAAVIVVVRLLLLLSAAGSAPTDQAARSHAKRLELLRSVLRRDAAWALMLNQRVKLTPGDRPPRYGQDEVTTTVDAGVRDRMRLIGGDAVAVAPLSVIRAVVGEFAWLGSYVEYAERLLRKAFACVAYVHVSHMVEMLQALEVKTAEALRKKAADAAKEESGETRRETVTAAAVAEDEEEEEEEEEELEDRFSRDVEPFRTTFREAWSTLTMLADQLAAVGGNLAVMADLSHLLGYATHAGRMIPFPVAELLRRKIDGTIDRHCDRHKPNLVYYDLGYREVRGEPFGETSTPRGLKSSIGSFSKRLFAFYGALRVETMATGTWAQLFDYRTANENGVTLHSAFRATVDKEPSRKRIKRKIREYDRAVLAEYARKRLEKVQKIDKVPV